ncbi:MAG: thioesterase [Bacteroidetes bacterium GWF2_49_14]|nr:MAG: thioesterase [Bacteroidetes bacterium GWF2_49_14]HBB91572.1 thioesterase [Bacteroidales bacterium]
MYSCDIKQRIRYGETDQMGYVYYGRYAEFYEIGRTELIRKLGFTYRGLEEQGIMLPVVSMNVRYIRPAGYDDLITIRTTLRKLPTARITFFYEIFNEAGDLLNEAECHLVFTDMQTRKPRRPPADLMAALEPHFV